MNFLEPVHRTEVALDMIYLINSRAGSATMVSSVLARGAVATKPEGSEREGLALSEDGERRLRDKVPAVCKKDSKKSIGLSELRTEFDADWAHL